MLTAVYSVLLKDYKKFGEDRVFDTPLAESGIGGLALGLAVTGYRPVMEIQFLGFVFEVFDEVAGQIARTRFRSGGSKPAPVTVRAPFGGEYILQNYTQIT